MQVDQSWPSRRHVIRAGAASAVFGVGCWPWRDLLAQPGCPALLSRTFPRLQDERPVSLCEFSGRVLLVVNTASYCGYTSQYEGLEALYARYRSHGLTVLGFPTNDFGQQEPGNNSAIAEFCFNTYGVKFPMFAKSTLKGTQANALVTDLARLSGQAPTWNFHKYLVSRDARVVRSFSSAVAPEDPALVSLLQAWLK